MRCTHRPLLAVLCSFLAAALLLAPSAAAQCVITGPTVVCSGGSVQLSGPSGNYEYIWSGPSGSLPNTQVVTVSEPGLYVLMLFDMGTGQPFGPCSHTLAPGTTPSCSITGPSGACEGQSVDLCGPTGSFSYAWTGPGGFSATGACVSVTTGGTYQLVVTDLFSGCASAPATHDVSFAPCGGTAIVNCPRVPAFWGSQCGASEPGPDAPDLTQLGACVDAGCAIFSWSDPRAGLCAVLNAPHPRSLRVRAKRQLAGVALNVCAQRLDPQTELVLEDLHTTVGEWLAHADARLVALEGLSLRSRGVREGYRAVIRVAWRINHGQGIGPTCGREEKRHAAQPSSLGGGVEDETLAAELADETESALAFERAWPNPASGAASIAYVVSDPTDQEVEVAVYDLGGRLVRRLVKERQLPGRYQIQWDGRRDDGRRATPGVYFVHARRGTARAELQLTLVD